jgi:tricorn protease
VGEEADGLLDRPAKQGRFVDVTRDPSVRYRGAHFLPDGKSLVALSDASGELEFWKLAANGLEKPVQLTKDNPQVYRFQGLPSPDGKWLVFDDKDWKLWLLDLKDKKTKQIDLSKNNGFSDLAWSPDSQWVAYVRAADNTYPQIWIYNLKTGVATPVTTDRVNSSNPVWSGDGKWLYFLSDRHLETVIGSPWGLREPEPYFDEPAGVFYVSLLKDERSPFQPNDELHPDGKDKDEDKDKDKEKEKGDKKKDGEKKKEAKKDKDGEKDGKKDDGDDKKKDDDDKDKVPEVKIDLAGIEARVQAAPIPTGNYTDLGLAGKHLFIEAHGTGLSHRRTDLKMVEISNDDPELKTFAEDIDGFEFSMDHKKILIRKDDSFYILGADSSAPAKLEKSVKLGDWTFALDPRQEWRQMFKEAWRLERDFFYDRNMHGVDWPEILKRNLPLVDRVTDRDELNDLISEVVGELSALHIFVIGGDHRSAPDNVRVASLGARLTPDKSAGGYRVEHIFQSDPDYPEAMSPLLKPGVNVHEGDVIEAINGIPAISEPMGELLRHQANQQVLLKVHGAGGADARETIVTPISSDQERDLRYDEWEYTRRLKTEELGHGDIGYLHLRAMGGGDIARWARDFYPVYNRKGLIIDVRHNNGGNIDSWILEKLLRKAWFYWQGRAGQPTWNMQYAFRGHVVVICDEHTASDGEAFSEGFKRLGLGKVIGTRTWGGEIWLSMDNVLVDKGIATAAEDGVYGPEGKWLIEGHGVDPDIVIDNPPHATFGGQDAQLQKAIDVLQEEIQRDPVAVPPPPQHPDKSMK